MNRITFLWLQAVAWGHILGGVLLFSGQPDAWFNAYLAHVTEHFTLTESGVDVLSVFVRFFGATIASWGVLMLTVVLGLKRRLNRSALMGLTVATALWFVLDSSLSWVSGLTVHLPINLFAVLSLLVPCTVLWIELNRESTTSATP